MVSLIKLVSFMLLFAENINVLAIVQNQKYKKYQDMVLYNTNTTATLRMQAGVIKSRCAAECLATACCSYSVANEVCTLLDCSDDEFTIESLPGPSFMAIENLLGFTYLSSERLYMTVNGSFHWTYCRETCSQHASWATQFVLRSPEDFEWIEDLLYSDDAYLESGFFIGLATDNTTSLHWADETPYTGLQDVTILGLQPNEMTCVKRSASVASPLKYISYSPLNEQCSCLCQLLTSPS